MRIKSFSPLAFLLRNLTYKQYKSTKIYISIERLYIIKKISENPSLIFSYLIYNVIKFIFLSNLFPEILAVVLTTLK